MNNRNIVKGSDGDEFVIDECSSAYGWTGSDLTTHTVTTPSGKVYKKTYTYTAGQVQTETGWVLQ